MWEVLAVWPIEEGAFRRYLKGWHQDAMWHSLGKHLQSRQLRLSFLTGKDLLFVGSVAWLVKKVDVKEERIKV